MLRAVKRLHKTSLTVTPAALKVVSAPGELYVPQNNIGCYCCWLLYKSTIYICSWYIWICFLVQFFSSLCSDCWLELTLVSKTLPWTPCHLLGISESKQTVHVFPTLLCSIYHSDCTLYLFSLITMCRPPLREHVSLGIALPSPEARQGLGLTQTCCLGLCGLQRLHRCSVKTFVFHFPQGSAAAAPTAEAWASAGGLVVARARPWSPAPPSHRRCRRLKPSGRGGRGVRAAVPRAPLRALPFSPSPSLFSPPSRQKPMSGGRRRPPDPAGGRGGAGAGGGGRTRRGGAREAGGGSAAAAGTGARHRHTARAPQRSGPARPAGGARWPPTGAAGSWGCGCWRRRRRGCAAGWRRASPPAATKCGRRFSCGRSGPSSWSPTCPRPVSIDPPAGWLLRAGVAAGRALLRAGPGGPVPAGLASACALGAAGIPAGGGVPGFSPGPGADVGGCATACQKPVRRGSLRPAPAFLPVTGSGELSGFGTPLSKIILKDFLGKETRMTPRFLHCAGIAY